MRLIPTQETGQLTAIASGTLPTGNPVVVNSDGTVSVITGTVLNEGVGTAQVLTGSSSGIAAVFDPNSSKVIVFYSASAYVGTVSGQTITFGSPVTYTTYNPSYISAAFDTANNKAVVCFRANANADYGTAVVCAINGNSITFGSPVTFNTGATSLTATTFDSLNNKIVVFYSNQAISYRGYVRVGTVTGTSIIFEPAVNITSGSVNNGLSATFDSAQGKVVISFSDGAGSNYGKTAVGEISGSTITFGSFIVFHTGFAADMSSTYDSVNGKVIIVYRDLSSSGNGTAIVGTVSGNSMTFGTAAVFNSADTQWLSVTYDSNARKILASYRNAGVTNYGFYTVGTVTGNSITFSSGQFEASATLYPSAVFDSTNNKVVIAYRNGTGINTAIVFQNSGVETNLTTENYVGIVSGPRKSFTQTQSVGSVLDATTSELYGGKFIFHESANKLIYVYRRNASIYAAIVTANGTSLSFGTPVTIMDSVNPFVYDVVYDKVAQKIVVFFRGDSNYSNVIVGDVSGTSITFGSRLVHETTNIQAAATYDEASGKIMVAQNNGYIKIGTVSGTSISFGTPVLYNSTGIYTLSATYDIKNRKSLIAIYSSADQSGGVYVATVSGTTASVGSLVTFASSISSVQGFIYNPTLEKSVLFYSLGSGVVETKVGTVSGTTISFGSGVTVGSVYSTSYSLGYDSLVNKYIYVYTDTNTTYPYKISYRTGSVSGDTITLDAATQLPVASIAAGIGFDSSVNTAVIAYVDDATKTGKAFALKTAGVYTLKGSVQSGGKAKITVAGSISKNQADLVPGQQYFVQVDGTIGTTAGSPAVLAGIALTTTDLLVK